MIDELGFQKGISRLKKHQPQVSIYFSLFILKHVMCLEVKKIFERKKVSEKVLYCFGRFIISPYAIVGLLYNLDMFEIKE